MGIQIANLSQSCLFGGKIEADPINSFPTILIASAIVYFLFLPVFAAVQLIERFKNGRKYMFVISLLMQIAAIMATVGFISFIELGVQSAQPFLVGGSEDTWGFGQILAMLVLILPTVERLEYGFSWSEEDKSKRNLRYWRDVQCERMWKGKDSDWPDSNDVKWSIEDEKLQGSRSGIWG
jgi:uncharacterized membrane protein